MDRGVAEGRGMTKEQFDTILSNATVRLVSAHGNEREGLFLQGITQQELADIVTVAGHAIGAIPADGGMNPKWLDCGPDNLDAGQWHFIS